MTIYEKITVCISISALLVTCIVVYYNAIQIKKSSEAILMQRQVFRGNTIENFSNRFFELLKQGRLHDKINDPDWAYQFWSLLATEFYFYHHCILPEFMYSLWMIDLAKLYYEENGTSIRKSHTNYLDTYSFQYTKMTDFFDMIHQISQKYSHEKARNENVSKFVKDWINENKLLELS